MRALVLSGGGAKGAYQVGALERLVQDGNDYDVVCGVSIGALNAAVFCSHPVGYAHAAVAALKLAWTHVSAQNVMRYRHLYPLCALWADSVYDTTPLRRWLAAFACADRIRVSGRRLRVTAVSADSGEVGVGCESDPAILDWVMASAAYPVFFPPQRIHGKLWLDGGLKSITPIGDAILLGATEVDVILCSDPDKQEVWPDAHKRAAFPDYLLRSIEILSDTVAQADVKTCGLKNDIARRSDRYKHVKLRVVKPSVNMTMHPLAFDKAAMRDAQALGYQDAATPVRL